MGFGSSVLHELGELWGGGRGPSLVIIASGWGLLLGMRMIYPVLIPQIRASYDLSLTMAGLLITILWMGSALGQLPSGILADHVSERKVMAASACTTALALLVVVTASSPLILFVGTGLVGFGLSLYAISRITILSDIYPERIGSALGVTMATGDIGQTLLPPISGILAVAVAWQVGLGFVIPLLLLVGIVIWVALPTRDHTRTGMDTPTVEGARVLFAEIRHSNLGLVLLILFLFLVIWQSFAGFYPTYLVDVKGFSPSTASLLFSLFFAFGVIVKPLSGAAYDRMSLRSALVIVLGGPVVGLALLPFIRGFWPLVGVTAVVSTMLGSGAITQSFLAESFPREVRGMGLGLIRTIAASLGAVGPVLFGAIADRGYFDEGYFLMSGMLIIVILFTLRIPRSTSPTESRTDP